MVGVAEKGSYRSARDNATVVGECQGMICSHEHQKELGLMRCIFLIRDVEAMVKIRKERNYFLPSGAQNIFGPGGGCPCCPVIQPLQDSYKG